MAYLQPTFAGVGSTTGSGGCSRSRGGEGSNFCREMKVVVNHCTNDAIISLLYLA